MAVTPGELLLLEASAVALQAATGDPPYWFDPDADAVFVVDIPELKHLGEFGHGYFVHPGDTIYQVDTGCKFSISGDFLVTGARRYENSPELPWDAGYVSLPDVRLKITQDIINALNQKELVPALADRTAIVPSVANRNLLLDVDGWAVAQVQFSFFFTEVIA